ncbi:MAG: protein phosphatase 2C domain-containing protein [Acidobacteriota bacterium]
MRPDSTSRELLHWASASDRGRVRPGNEDFAGDPTSLAALAGPEANLAARGALFAVADGMGGHSRGEVASKLAVEVLFTIFYTAPGEPAERFRLAMIAANTAVRRAGILAAPETGGRPDAGPLRPMGTTLVAAVVLTPWVLFGNVGDSRAYLLQNGTLEQVSRDHTYLAEEIRRGLVTEEAAAAALPFRHLITRSMGSRDDIEVDLFWRPWPAGSTLLLATDGLHGVVDDARVAAILASQPPDVAVRHLVESANEAGGPDNVTVVVVQSPQPEPRTRFTA